jgi:hypothetical protein
VDEELMTDCKSAVTRLAAEALTEIGPSPFSEEARGNQFRDYEFTMNALVPG